MPARTHTIAALAAGLALAALAAAAQEPAGTAAAQAPPAEAPAGEMPPADQPVEALPAPAEPPPLAAPAAVPVETLHRLARAADGVWRVAVLAERRTDGGRFADRVALTQADLARRIERLARALGAGLPGGPSPEARQRVETLRAQPPGAYAAVLAALVRQEYPDLIATLEGWTAGPEQAVAAALLPPLREELEMAAAMAAPALTGASGPAGGSGTSAPPASSDGGEPK